jgi:hypothetical protein
MTSLKQLIEYLELSLLSFCSSCGWREPKTSSFTALFIASIASAKINYVISFPLFIKD